MVQINNLESRWLAEKKLLMTRLCEEVDITSVVQWERSLVNKVEEIPDGNAFKIFIDLFGFKAVDLDTHKRFRSVIPVLLSQYNWRIGYLNLFEEANDLVLSSKRGVQCFGAAHVHQDETKIEKYQSMFGTDAERYFTNPAQAWNWINQLTF